MNVLYLPGYRYPASLDEPLTSGDLRYSFTLSRALSRLGHNVTVISRMEDGDMPDSSFEGIRILRYRGLLSGLFGTSFDVSINRYRLFKRILRNTDLVICNSPLTIEHFLRISPPIVYVASGLEDTKNYSLSLNELLGFIAIKALRDPLKRLTWKRSILVNTTATFEKDTLTRWGVPESKIGTISSSVDTSNFYPQMEAGNKIREKHGISNSENVILSVSRFTPAKGILETIEAFQKLDTKDCTLFIVGVHHSHDRSYYSKVVNAVKDAREEHKIILAEDVPEKHLPAYYSSASITSVFSVGYDPLPTVIIESMACGTPVVSTYFKTREQFIDDGVTGLFVNEGDLMDWVEKVDKLLNNDKLEKSIAEQSLQFVSNNFNSTLVAEKLLRTVSHE